MTIASHTTDSLNVRNRSIGEQFTSAVWGLVLVALSLVVFGCSDDSSPTSPAAETPSVHSVEIDGAPSSMEVAETVTVTAIVDADDEIENLGVVWSTSSSDIVSVDQNGQLTAMVPGSAQITARSIADENIEDEIEIVVVSPEAVILSVSIEPLTDGVYRGDTVQLSANVDTEGFIDASVEWSSNRPHIASVDSKGRVIAESVGSAEITARSTADPTKSDRIVLDINEPTIASVEIEAPESVMTPGQTQNLAVTVDARGAIDSDVRWFSSDSTVVDVLPGGQVHARAVGTVTIAAVSLADDSKRDEVSLTVEPGDFELALNERISIRLDFHPNLFVANDNFSVNILTLASDGDRVDATFMTRPGLSGEGVSFEAVGAAGYYLRHTGFRLQIMKDDGSVSFEQDASFHAKSFTNEGEFALEAVNFPNHYVRSENRQLWLRTGFDLEDSTYRITTPAWTRGSLLNLPGQAKDISIGADGTVFAIGTAAASGGFIIRKWNVETRSWENFDGTAVRIAVDPNGNPWVVNSINLIFHHDGTRWTQIAGEATDIEVGADGTVYAVGVEPRGVGGAAILRYNGQGWDDMGGEAARISVDPEGKPWYVNAEGTVYGFDGSSIVRIPGILGTDISVGADGTVWLVEMDSTHLAYFDGTRFVRRTDTLASEVATDPFGRVWHTTGDEDIFAQF